MRILVTNDDGIHAPGLKICEEIARKLSDDVTVVAPEHDQSGVSHSLSQNDPLRLRQIGYLRRFPFDEIKLDRSFVSALEHDPTVAAIVRATLCLGRSLGMVSVAEGVESAGQLTLLDTEGCCIAQGFYFSPPVPAGEIELMIRAAATPDSHDFPIHEFPKAS
jgi:hypothetical protein